MCEDLGVSYSLKTSLQVFCVTAPTPQMPPLPICRVSEEPLFSYVGVDFAGPICQE